MTLSHSKAQHGCRRSRVFSADPYRVFHPSTTPSPGPPPHSAASTVGTDNDVITLRAQNQALAYELNDCQDELSQREQDYEHLLLICAAG